MTELSLFTGSGGGLLGSILLGHKFVGYVERDQYCQKVIRQRIRDGYLDDAPIFDDVRTFDGRPYRDRVDIITAGFPCQPFSTAGKRKGAADERNAWPDTLRILNEVRPRVALLENVPGLIRSGYFETILQGLADSGFDAKWEVISAAEVGAPHLRKRLWIVAYPGSERRQQDARGTSSDESENGGRSQENNFVERNGESGGTGDVANPYGERRILRRLGIEVDGREVERFANDYSRGISTLYGGEWWEAEPAVGRVVDGLANRLDRLRALGNGQVPIVAATAFRCLMGAR